MATPDPDRASGGATRAGPPIDGRYASPKCFETPLGGFVSRSAPATEDASPAERLADFVDRSGYVLGHPLFETAERAPRLELADLLRSVLRALERRDGGIAAITQLRDELASPRWPLHASPRSSVDALVDWARSDQRTLSESLEAFTSDEDARRRFSRFAASSVVWTRERLNRDVWMEIGSLFNFALEPERLPIVRRGLSLMLARKLGSPIPRPKSIAEEYESHLEFSEFLLESLRRRGAPIRDMLDVHALVCYQAIGDEFWKRQMPTFDAEGAKEKPSAAVGRLARGASYLAVCSCLGYDTAYLEEWLDFHRLVGVERFFLYNNGDRERQRKLLEPYVREGLVRLYEWPEFPPQVPAARHCLAHHRDDARWIAFIDTDEFLFSPTLEPLPEVLRAYEGWPGVGVNQVAFGPSGHRRKPAGLVLESYTKAVAGFSIKSVVNPRQVTDIWGPHHFAYRSGGAVDETFYPLWWARSVFPSSSRLRINHYYTRSEEEFLAKWSRRMPDFGGERDWAEFKTLLSQLEAQGSDDTAILPYVSRLRSAPDSQPV
jgi:hypothetical protein